MEHARGCAVLTPDEVRQVVRARGIFAAPTPSGARGAVLIASLGLDLLDPRVVIALLRLHRTRDIPLVHVDAGATATSLRARGVALHTEVVGDGHATYEALELEAVAATADSIAHHQIQWLWREAVAISVVRPFGQSLGSPPVAVSTCARALSYWTSYSKISRADHRAARAACAAAWNHVAGVLTQDG